MPKESLCIIIPKMYGEKAIAFAGKLAIIDRMLEIQSDAKHVYIPITRQLSAEELAGLQGQVPDYTLKLQVFPEKKKQSKTVMEILEGQLPPHLMASLPKALDIVGDIVIVEVPLELESHRSLLGVAILEAHKNVRTVLAKASAVGGEYRLRDFEVIAGEHRTHTVHKEFGCTYQVDVAKAYFSPRLSHEHKRVSSLVQAGETVVDLFAGVGPFSVLIAKNREVRVYAVDLNPDAVELLRTNIRLNRVENRVLPILGDARRVVEEKLEGFADRVIMNLPEKAIEFVDVACKALKPEGGVVHFYGFVHEPDSLDALKARFAEAVADSRRRVDQFLLAKAVRETAPYECQVVLDAKII
ncbi:MAG TPA: class I SAM-dependent methyltransferase family protein [Candidatus Bathyarchaeia archaeon]|nr:class I SAM-dependent methyltransferase family protein [Candidatus Bathyarchaeia archaeon]